MIHSNYFTFDPISRKLSYISTDDEKIVLVTKDHKSKRLHFKIPKVIGGLNVLSDCSILIHYDNVNSKTKEVSSDVYKVIDAAESDEEGMIEFSWKIESQATKHAGLLKFALSFASIQGESYEYYLSSIPFVNIIVYEGINNAESLEEKYSDIIAQLLSSKEADWDHLTGKPFGEESVVYFEITDDYVPIDQAEIDDGVVIYKVSNEPLTKEQAIGSVVYSVPEMYCTFEVTEELITSTADGVMGINDVIISLDADTSSGGMTLTRGLWVYYKFIKMEKTTIHKIDEKFLPELNIPSSAVSWKDVTDKPFGDVSETTETVYYSDFGTTQIGNQLVVSNSELLNNIDGRVKKYSLGISGENSIILEFSHLNIEKGLLYYTGPDGAGLIVDASAKTTTINFGKEYRYNWIELSELYEEYSKLPMNFLPEVTEYDNGSFLGVENGAWALISIEDGNEVAY